MSDTPQFYYFISHPGSPVTNNSNVWQQPLPVYRKLSGINGEISICHGEYFSAVRTFFEKHGYDVLSQALTQKFQKNVRPVDIQEISIFLEKHGAFYHPARIEALACDQKISFVLNVAVSEAGVRNINEEYHNLKKLNDEFSLSYLPRVYGLGEVRSAGNRRIVMFLGEWIEGYKEFHVSRDPSDNKNKLKVWNGSNSPFFLSLRQTAKLYKQAAGILTYYYNIETFEQIFPWHHAAGDFVVSVDSGDLEVKLITVRRYASLYQNITNFNNSEIDAELILQALLIFLLNLSIRMRLDRLDGVGDIIWSDSLAVQSTLAGFLEGLALKPHPHVMPDSLDRCFKYYLSVCTKEDLYDLSKAVVDTFNRRAPEVPIVRMRLKEHVEVLNQAIKRTLGQS